jgi:hypothetical protein
MKPWPWPFSWGEFIRAVLAGALAGTAGGLLIYWAEIALFHVK